MPISSYREEIIRSFYDFIKVKEYPCIAAKAAAAHDNIMCMVGASMEDSSDDHNILSFLYQFVDDYRNSERAYHTAAVIFEGPLHLDEEQFDQAFWKKLQSLANLDAVKYPYDDRVSSDPQSPHFSFSLKGEAFFIVALHPNSSRKARNFNHPMLVFNPHQQFEMLRKNRHFEPMKDAVRKRDLHFSGSVNPMLEDFDVLSEVFQYSGKVYDEHWKCPLHITHGQPGNHSTSHRGGLHPEQGSGTDGL